jgi:hypothetical protein
MAFARRNQFKTRHEAHAMRKFIWICCNCRKWHHETKPSACPCGSEGFDYFMSKREAERAASLFMMAHYGDISKLELQPAFPWIENGIKIFTYKADFRYINRKGETVVEDVKASVSPKSWDPIFVLKKKWIEARYQVTISIVTGR